MSESSKVKRTYGSRSTRPIPSSPCHPSPATTSKRRRPLGDHMSCTNFLPAKKRVKSFGKPSTQNKKGLTQLHFCPDTSILRTCPLCDLSYTKGALDDEGLHRAHCARVQRGMEWGREEEKEKIKAGVQEVATGVKLKDGRRGRIISFRADISGKIGSKLAILLETVDLTLSSPPLISSILQVSKAYLFLVPAATSSREKIVGCVIAQRISTAMAVAAPLDSTSTSQNENGTTISSSMSHSFNPAPSPASATPLIAVDTSRGLFCHPEPLPTPLGIPRLFVASTHRRQGIASSLLSAAAATFVHGCPVDPAKGEVAFTQPTDAGHAVMQVWGKGGARIYEE